MDIKDLVEKFKNDSAILGLTESLRGKKIRLRAKGLYGSGDALVSGIASESLGRVSLFILHDKEEADYFLQDLEMFFPKTNSLLFPISYKKPYQYEEVENANVLQRAEALNMVGQRLENENLFIVTYPQALSEKVINKRSLVENTFSVSVGEKLDSEFLAEFLASFDFERTDFVYEPGQFAIRGGIIDVFSFSKDKPLRIELFGEEVESIREFDVESQLSSTSLKNVSIIPNVQKRMFKEERQSFLEYLPDNTTVWIKDYRECIDLLDKSFDKVTESFEKILSVSDNTQVISGPEVLFENSESIIKQLDKTSLVEFGRRFYLKSASIFDFDYKPQPNFNKNFQILGDNLNELRSD